MVHCSRGRLVNTLIGAVKEHVEKLEVKARERKMEKGKKVEEEKEVLEEVLFSVTQELVKKAEVVEVPGYGICYDRN